MKNLAQIRARNALRTSQDGNKALRGKEGGELIKKIPPIIMNHGFLAAAAYACDDKNRGWRDAFDAIAEHLADPEIGCIPPEAKTLEAMLSFLCSDQANSETLKRVTAESMEWLNFARRFIKKDNG